VKYLTVALLGILVVSGCAGVGRGRSGQAPGAESGLVGTWERRPPEDPGYRHIKILGPQHFMWAVYEGDTGAVVAVGGGTYSFDGRVYIEMLEFGSENLPGELIGEAQVFVAIVDDGVWHHEGTLSNGAQVRETWTRSRQ
jgi:hypothetical protein